MGYLVPDDVLRQAGVSEAEARLELACALFDADRLDAAQAAMVAGIDREAFDAELERRGIPLIRPTVADFEEDLRTLRNRDNAA